MASIPIFRSEILFFVTGTSPVGVLLFVTFFFQALHNTNYYALMLNLGSTSI